MWWWCWWWRCAMLMVVVVVTHAPNGGTGFTRSMIKISVAGAEEGLCSRSRSQLEITR